MTSKKTKPLVLPQGWPFITRRTVRQSARIIAHGDQALINAVLTRRLSITEAYEAIVSGET